MATDAPLVGVLMGSTSDWGVMKTVKETLESFGVPHECKVLSAHRTPQATVEYVPTIVGLPEMSQAVADAGYEVLPLDQDGTDEGGVTREARNMQEARRRMILAWAFTIPIVIWMLPEMIAGIAWPNEMVAVLITPPQLPQGGTWPAVRYWVSKSASS